MYKVVDLFAGAGGLSLGFEETGEFEVVAFVENNKNATKTYLENNKNAKHYSDILKLDFKKLNKELGNIDIVIGGPPCQGFSNANRQRRKIINGSNELVKRYVEAIKVLQPNIFVMENVKTIDSDKHFFCLTSEDKDYIINELKLKIYPQEVILYNRNEYIEELHKSIEDNSYLEWTQIQESELYLLKNMLKKANSIKKFLDKKSNIKTLELVVDQLQNESNEPNWLSELNNNTKNLLRNIIANGEILKTDILILEVFCDVQRLFIGINELREYDAIYDLNKNNISIVISLHAYKVIEYVKRSFEYLGYNIEGNVLNAADFGVPQSRERFIMMGIKKTFIDNLKIEFPKPIIEDKNNYITVREAIEDLSNYEPSTGDMSDFIEIDNQISINSFLSNIIYEGNSQYIYNHVCTDSRDVAKERFKMIKQGDNFHSLPDNLKDTYANPERTQNTIYKRLDYDNPSDTVVNVRKSMWIHPIKDRAISAREAARLQSFPDWYKFIGTKDSVYQQIGNAVPPLLGRAIAEKVLDILEPDIEHEELRKIFKDKILKMCK
ncbi:DNA cytosine methyltransferase [Clostridium sp.]|uniref:DNA cytosine methyltransferase n=1 Tax=Clostridium sp. TaxID=1506 RepID=UPI0039904723